MNNHQRGIGAYKRRVEFNRCERGRPSRQETISYTFFTGAPNEGAIKATVAKYTRKGWWYAARKEDEGLFGLGARTILTFQR